LLDRANEQEEHFSGVGTLLSEARLSANAHRVKFLHELGVESLFFIFEDRYHINRIFE
jgi:hypothetical protein